MLLRLVLVLVFLFLPLNVFGENVQPKLGELSKEMITTFKICHNEYNKLILEETVRCEDNSRKDCVKRSDILDVLSRLIEISSATTFYVGMHNLYVRNSGDVSLNKHIVNRLEQDLERLDGIHKLYITVCKAVIKQKQLSVDHAKMYMNVGFYMNTLRSIKQHLHSTAQ